ncbi:MAG: hypothetical protein LUD72_09055 [Bacteroidales bacterium]|nr:hypothetical protein [Bacteroidales bacterium]
MNRKQRRAISKTGKKYIPMPKSDMTTDQLPTSRLIATINSSLVELEARGIRISDWDNDDRKLRRIQIKHGRYCYLTAEDGERDA